MPLIALKAGEVEQAIREYLERRMPTATVKEVEYLDADGTWMADFDYEARPARQDQQDPATDPRDPVGEDDEQAVGVTEAESIV